MSGDLYRIAQQVTDEVLGTGAYAKANAGHPDPRVQQAIQASRIGQRVIEETVVVHLGDRPGEQYGWECASCQEVTGLQFGTHEEGAQQLAAHVVEQHPHRWAANESMAPGFAYGMDRCLTCGTWRDSDQGGLPCPG